MIRGTTPDYILTLAGVDLTGQTVYVTMSQGTRKFTLSGDRLSIATDATGSIIAFMLTQNETLALMEGPASVQVRFIDATGYARATEIATVAVNRVLLERVIQYADDTDQG